MLVDEGSVAFGGAGVLGTFDVVDSQFRVETDGLSDA